MGYTTRYPDPRYLANPYQQPLFSGSGLSLPLASVAHQSGHAIPKGPTILPYQKHSTMIPPGLKSKHPIMGYDDAHSQFEKFRKHFQNQSVTTVLGQEVVVQGTLWAHATEKPVRREVAVMFPFHFRLSLRTEILLSLACYRNNKLGPSPCRCQ